MPPLARVLLFATKRMAMSLYLGISRVSPPIEAPSTYMERSIPIQMTLYLRFITYGTPTAREATDGVSCCQHRTLMTADVTRSIMATFLSTANSSIRTLLISLWEQTCGASKISDFLQTFPPESYIRYIGSGTGQHHRMLIRTCQMAKMKRTRHALISRSRKSLKGTPTKPQQSRTFPISRLMPLPFRLNFLRSRLPRSYRIASRPLLRYRVAPRPLLHYQIAPRPLLHY